MSKAFTRDDAAETPVVVPARAPLPPGIANYVTARGLALLRAELAERQTEHAQRAQAAATADASANASAEASVRATLAASAARLAELEQRLATAVLVDPRAQLQTLRRDEVRFGAQVTVRSESGSQRTYRIVGVDEADGTQGLVAFVAPLARVLLGRRVGEVVTLKTPRGEEELELVAVSYEDPAASGSGGAGAGPGNAA